MDGLLSNKTHAFDIVVIIQRTVILVDIFYDYENNFFLFVFSSGPNELKLNFFLVLAGGK